MRAGNGSGDDQARRFRDAALPHLDDVYTLARYLLRDGANADDAVQECYLRALRYFDTYHAPAMKPWLFAILRNICRENSHPDPVLRSKCKQQHRPFPSRCM